MRFTCSQIKFLSPAHFRVLLSAEMGTKNHEAVPVELIEKIAHVKCNINAIITDLVRQSFLKRVPDIPYEGYALTHAGYDNLALYALQKENVIVGVGGKIGVGKESDVYIGLSPENKLLCIKIHRLGRICFKTVKLNRDYHQNRKHTGWIYLSRLSAEREFSFMKKLYLSIPMPKPISQNRHIVVMEYLQKYTLLAKIPKSSNSYLPLLEQTTFSVLEDIKNLGYAHGDFNEFNIMVRNDYKKIKIIDFPQMIPMTSSKAEKYYIRDKESLSTYFRTFSEHCRHSENQEDPESEQKK